MDEVYTGEKTTFSALDRALIQAVYPLVAPTPGQPPSHTTAVAAGQYVSGVDFGDHKVSPLLTLPPSTQQILAGTPTAIALGSFIDSGANTAPWTVDVGWADGSPDSIFKPTQAILSAGHTYASPGTYQMTVRVTDRFGSTGYAEFTLSVTSLPMNSATTLQRTARTSSQTPSSTAPVTSSASRLPVAGAASAGAPLASGAGQNGVLGGAADFGKEQAAYAVTPEWTGNDPPDPTRVDPLSGTAAGELNGPHTPDAPVANDDGMLNALPGSEELDVLFAGLTDGVADAKKRRGVIQS
jgi:hypothetical protein